MRCVVEQFLRPGKAKSISFGYGRFICRIGYAFLFTDSYLKKKRSNAATRMNEKQNRYTGNKTTVLILTSCATYKSGRDLNFTYSSAYAITH